MNKQLQQQDFDEQDITSGFVMNLIKLTQQNRRLGKQTTNNKQERKAMHIDKYIIRSMDYTWKNGKQSKNTSVQQEMTSKECIMGRTFLQLLSDLDQAWHQHGTGKDCKIEVTFTPHEYKDD